MNTSTFSDGDAVLADFAADPGARLSEWAERYPEHACALARLAAARWAAPLEGAAAPEAPHVLALGLATLAERRARDSASLSSLLAAAHASGLDDDAVAAALLVPVGIFWKLHRRLIAFSSIPERLMEQLGAVLGCASGEVAAYLRQPPALAAGASYRADETPETRQESFADALDADPETTAEMRNLWQ